MNYEKNAQSVNDLTATSPGSRDFEKQQKQHSKRNKNNKNNIFAKKVHFCKWKQIFEDTYR